MGASDGLLVSLGRHLEHLARLGQARVRGLYDRDQGPRVGVEGEADGRGVCDRGQRPPVGAEGKVREERQALDWRSSS